MTKFLTRTLEKIFFVLIYRRHVLFVRSGNMFITYAQMRNVWKQVGRLAHSVSPQALEELKQETKSIKIDRRLTGSNFIDEPLQQVTCAQTPPVQGHRAFYGSSSYTTSCHHSYRVMTRQEKNVSPAPRVHAAGVLWLLLDSADASFSAWESFYFSPSSLIAQRNFLMIFSFITCFSSWHKAACWIRRASE